ncbi:MAG: N-acetylmuramoyl-L-alanine amidase [Aggregatilineales bacterium]
MRDNRLTIILCLFVFGLVSALLTLNNAQNTLATAPVQSVQSVQNSPTLTPSFPTATPLPVVGGQENVSVTVNLPSQGITQQTSGYVSDVIAVPLDNPQPFLDVGSIWRLSSPLDDTGVVTVGMRGSVDGAAWAEWTTHDHFHLTDSGDMYGHLITFPAETRFIQFQITWNTRIDVQITAVELAFISPGATSQTVINQLNQQTEPVPIARLAQAQPVVSRTNWGCPDGQNSPQWSPSYTTISHLIVHHTVSPNGESDYPARMRSIWNYHTNSLGWGDIGYNYLIDPNGVIYEGRAGGDGSVGAHFSCMNSRTMGIAMIGTFSSQSPTQNALRSLERLLAWKADSLNISPLNTSYHSPSALNLRNISGHRDGNSSPYGCPGGTVCPGDVLYGLLPQIRNNVQAIVQNAATATPTPTTTPTPTRTPTPTITPIGFAFNMVDHIALLDGMQRFSPENMRIILVVFREQYADVYVEIGGVTGIATVYFQPSYNFAVFAVQTVTPQITAVPLSESYVDTVNSTLPQIIIDGLDFVLTRRYPAGYDVEGLRVVNNMLEVGLIEP